jgi:hypothetical protein
MVLGVDNGCSLVAIKHSSNRILQMAEGCNKQVTRTKQKARMALPESRRASAHDPKFRKRHAGHGRAYLPAGGLAPTGF